MSEIKKSLIRDIKDCIPETIHYKGKLKKIDCEGTLEEKCQKIIDAHSSSFESCWDQTAAEIVETVLDEDYIIYGYDIYKIIENKKNEDEYFISFFGSDDIISFDIKYDDAKMDFSEAIQKAIRNIKMKKYKPGDKFVENGKTIIVFDATEKQKNDSACKSCYYNDGSPCNDISCFYLDEENEIGIYFKEMKENRYKGMFYMHMWWQFDCVKNSKTHWPDPKKYFHNYFKKFFGYEKTYGATFVWLKDDRPKSGKKKFCNSCDKVFEVCGWSPEDCEFGKRYNEFIQVLNKNNIRMEIFSNDIEMKIIHNGKILINEKEGYFDFNSKENY